MIPIIEVAETSAADSINDVNKKIRALVLTLSTGNWRAEEVILSLNDIAVQTTKLADTLNK